MLKSCCEGLEEAINIVNEQISVLPIISLIIAMQSLFPIKVIVFHSYACNAIRTFCNL